MKVDTLETIIKTDTIKQITFPDQFWENDFDVNYKDTLVIVTNKYKKLKVRLEIANYFNDNRPLVIRQINIKDIFSTEFKFKIRCQGLPYDPLYNPNKLYDLPNFTEIPKISAVKYEERGNEINSNFVAESQYLEIQGNRIYIIDFLVWTKDSQIKIVCKVSGCAECEEAEKLLFEKISSRVDLLVDRPDYNDNTKIVYNQIETVYLK